MARWLTFDGKTASTLRKQLPREQVFEHGSRNAVEYASVSNQNLVTLLPTGSSGEVAIAVFRQPASRTASSAAPASKPALVEKPASAVHASTTPQAAPSVWKVVVPTPTPSNPETPAFAEQNEVLQKPEVSLPFVRQKSPVHRAGGILGTRDEFVFDDEEPVRDKANKNWWQRFWDEDD